MPVLESVCNCTRGEGGGTLELVRVRGRQRTASFLLADAGRGGSGQADRDSQQGSFRVALGPEVSREASRGSGSVRCRGRTVAKDRDVDGCVGMNRAGYGFPAEQRPVAAEETG